MGDQLKDEEHFNALSKMQFQPLTEREVLSLMGNIGVAIGPLTNMDG